MLSKRQLVRATAVLLLGLVLINIAVVYLTRNSMPRRVMRHARESQSATVLALGNSLVAAAVDETAFASAAGLPVASDVANLGLGGSAPLEQLLLFRYGIGHGMRPRLVLYGFYDFQLTSPFHFSTADLIGNHAMLYYVEPFYARRFYSLSLHDAFQFRVMRAVPMFADRGAIWAKVELMRRALGQQGLPVQRSNQFGRAGDFSFLESDNAEDFRRLCETSVALPLDRPVSELLRQVRDAGMTVAVVQMPMRGTHRTMFYDTAWWAQYVAHLRNLLAPYGAIYVDASHWIEDDSLFTDPLHLSGQGAIQFSHRLGKLLGPEMTRLSVCPTTPSEARSSSP